MRDHDTRRHSRHDAETGRQPEHDHDHEDWHEHEHHEHHEHGHEGRPDFEDRGGRSRGGPRGPRGGGRRGQFRGGPPGWGPGPFRGPGPRADGPREGGPREGGPRAGGPRADGPWAGGPWARGPWGAARGCAAPSTWRDGGGEPPAAAAELRAQLGQLKMALVPIALTGTEDQQSRAREILTQTRTALYRILAEEADVPSARETASTQGSAAGPAPTPGRRRPADQNQLLIRRE